MFYVMFFKKAVLLLKIGYQTALNINLKSVSICFITSFQLYLRKKTNNLMTISLLTRANCKPVKLTG